MGWTAPCRAATTANITISTALNNGDTLDGVTLATGDRVLVKDQSTGSQNGIYVVGASPARSVDYTSSVDIVGSVVVVSEGTANADTAWKCTTNATITVGSTALVFAAFGSGGGGGMVDVAFEDGSSPTTPTLLRVAGYIDLGGGDLLLFPQITGNGAAILRFNAVDNSIKLASADEENYLEISTASDYALLRAGPAPSATFRVKKGYTHLQVPHTPADVPEDGFNIIVGDDFVNLYFSEKDANTIQVYPESGWSGLDVELKDNDGGVFKHVTDGGDESIPSLGILRKLAAAPGSPVEGESYYDTVLKKVRTYDGTVWQNHW